MRKGMVKEGMLEQDVLKEGLLNMARARDIHVQVIASARSAI